MCLLDVSIVNIAIPSIQRDLHASYADVQWALAGYTLAYALVLITGGRAPCLIGYDRLRDVCPWRHEAGHPAWARATPLLVFAQ